MKKALSSLLVIGVIGATAVGLSSAFFSDTETSSGNTFTAGTLDLTVDSEDNPPALIIVSDLKPGDDVFKDKILKVIDNPAFVWMHIKDLDNDQGVATEPEGVDETLLGGPKSDIQNYLTYDLSVDAEVIIDFDDDILLPDAVSCWIPLGELPGNTNITVTQSFHFDETAADWAQGDTLTFTEEFYAEQVRNNPNASPPDLGTGRVWSEETLTCNFDLTGAHALIFTCVTGCSGTYPHTMTVDAVNTTTGAFSGTGEYDPNTAYTWSVTGNAIGSGISFHILYTGLSPGYTVDATGILAEDGTSAGTAFSSSGQTFNWTMN